MSIEIKNTTKKYKTSNFMVYSCQYHVIFCSKYRRKVLVDDVAIRLKELVIEKSSEIGVEILEMEVMPDHIHLLMDVSPELGIHKAVTLIKGYTSNKLRSEFPSLTKKLPTLWTRSKFISTVGSVSLEVVKKYIEDQTHK